MELQICDKAVECKTQKDLSRMGVVFMLCFESGKKYASRAKYRPLIKELENLFTKLSDDCSKFPEDMRIDFGLSDKIALSVFPVSVFDDEHISAKYYEVIRAHKSYAPYGYNLLIKSGRRSKYDREELSRLIEEISGDEEARKCSCFTSNKRKRLAEIDKNGSIVKMFDSIAEASSHYGLPRPNISAVCNGRLRSVSGRVFRFVDTLRD